MLKTRNTPTAVALAFVAACGLADRTDRPASTDSTPTMDRMGRTLQGTAARATAAVDGCRPNFDASLPPSGSLEADGAHSWAIDGYTCEGRSILRLYDCGPGGGPCDAREALVDAVSFDPLEPGEVFVQYFCSFEGEADGLIVALARYEDVPVFDEILAAWRADLEEGAIVSLPAAPVECANEAYGA